MVLGNLVVLTCCRGPNSVGRRVQSQVVTWLGVSLSM